MLKLLVKRDGVNCRRVLVGLTDYTNLTMPGGKRLCLPCDRFPSPHTNEFQPNAPRFALKAPRTFHYPAAADWLG